MKKIIIYSGAFIVGLVFINLGFYLVPVYRLSPSRHVIFAPLSIVFACFIFGLPPVAVYFRCVLKNSWSRALLKGTVTIASNVLVMASLAFVIMRGIGKI